VIAAILLALAFSVTWVASFSLGDLYSPLNSGLDGTSTLAGRGFLPVHDDLVGRVESANASSVLLIIGPVRSFTSAEASSMYGFVWRGGLLVVVDNFGSGNYLLDLLGVPVRFDGRLLIDPLFYRKQTLFPVISDFSQSQFLTGVSELVLNNAAVLNATTGSNVKVLAGSSPFSFLDSNQDGKKESQEPSGPFPILAEVRLGQGTVLLFSSPVSLTNGLVGEAKNSILIDNILKYGAKGGASLLLDETHLAASGITPVKQLADDLVTSVLEGNMRLSMKLAMIAFVVVLLAGRYMYRRPPPEIVGEARSQGSAESPDIESTLHLHPTWDRRKLEFVVNEIRTSVKWRQLNEGE
jgi:hypothetical protein